MALTGFDLQKLGAEFAAERLMILQARIVNGLSDDFCKPITNLQRLRTWRYREVTARQEYL